jgi:hypothetical protein
MNLGDIISEHNKRTLRRTSAEGIVVSTSGGVIWVKVDGVRTRARNTRSIPIFPTDHVALIRDRGPWSIVGVLSSSFGQTNPSQNNPGGGFVLPYAVEQGGVYAQLFDSTLLNTWLVVSENVEFRTLRDRVLATGHVQFVGGGTLPGQARARIRATVDEMISSPYAETRAYANAATDWNVVTFTSVIGGLAPGDHVLNFEVYVSAVSASFNTTVSTFAMSVAEL